MTANTGDHTLTIVDAHALQPIGTIPLDRPPHAVALSRDARLALVTDNSEGSRVVVIVDLVLLRQASEITVGSRPDGITIEQRSGQAVVTNSGDNTISLFDPALAAGAQVVDTVSVGQTPRGVGIVSVDGASKAFVANEGDGSVSVVELGARQVTATVQAGGRLSTVAVAADGSQVFVLKHDANREDSVVILDARSDQRLAEVPVARDLTGLVAGPGGGSLFITSLGPNHNLYRLDLATRQVTGSFQVAGTAGATAIAIGPDGKRLLITTVDGKLVKVDPESDQPGESLNVGREPADLAVAGPGA